MANLTVRRLLGVVVTLTLAACASTPRGPSDAEVEMELDASLQAMTLAVVDGDWDGLTDFFTDDARMNLENINGVSQEVVGHAAIRSLVSQNGAPPDLNMTAQTFERSGTTAVQTGVWDITGLVGTFSVGWVQTDMGWKINDFDFIG